MRGCTVACAMPRQSPPRAPPPRLVAPPALLFTPPLLHVPPLFAGSGRRIDRNGDTDWQERLDSIADEHARAFISRCMAPPEVRCRRGAAHRCLMLCHGACHLPPQSESAPSRMPGAQPAPPSGPHPKGCALITPHPAPPPPPPPSMPPLPAAPHRSGPARRPLPAAAQEGGAGGPHHVSKRGGAQKREERCRPAEQPGEGAWGERFFLWAAVMPRQGAGRAVVKGPSRA